MSNHYPEQYIIVPASVLQSDMNSNSKLLYGLILSLSSKNKFDNFSQLGQCYANNEYLARNLGIKSHKTIQTSINELERKGFIRRELNRTSHNQKRRILEPLREGFDMKFIKSEDIWAKKESESLEKERRQMIEQEHSVKKDLKEVPEDVLKCFQHVVELFPEDFRPKDELDKVKWLKTIAMLDEVEGITPRQVWYITKKTLEDDFWKDKFNSIHKLRRRNSQGVKFVYSFKAQFAKDMIVE